MDIRRQQILIGLGLSSAYIIWYAYRKWRNSQCSSRCCQPNSQAIHGFVIDSFDEWYRCQDKIIDKIESARFVAVKCVLSETLPQRQKVTLLALSTSADKIALIRLSKLGEIPDEIVSILRDHSIIKVGVRILEYAALLEEEYGIEINGCLDLRYMALATPSVKRELIVAGSDLSLSSMADVLLMVRFAIDDRDMINLNWDVPKLSYAQCHYLSGRATSAFRLAVEIARANGLVSQIIGTLLKPDLWLEHFIRHQYATYIDIPFRRERMTRFSMSSRPPALAEKALRSYSTLKTPLYDNCVLLCPDLEQLCTCDKRKAQWYLDNGLGEKVNDEPLTVRLTFEPAQRAILDAQYYCLSKKNICVVCGTPENLVRKYVVPREYRKHFPKIMKHHNAHDIVLTCLNCHSKCCWLDELLKEKLGELCGAPLHSNPTKKYIGNEALRSVRMAGNALRKFRNRMPEKRRVELEEVLKSHFEVEELSDELIEFAMQIDYREANVDYVSHGKKVVDYFSRKGLLMFETLWREFFLFEMKPEFLPELWSADHHHDVIAVKLSFIREVNPEEAESLMKILGITSEMIEKILQRLKEQDNVNFSRLNFQKGRLMEDLPAESV